MTLVVLIVTAWLVLDAAVVGAFVAARRRRQRVLASTGMHDLAPATTAALLRA